MKTSIINQSKLFVLILLCFMSTIAINAQVAINTTSTQPDPSAMLDVTSTSLGVLIPRMSMSSVPGTPATGLLVYVTAGGSSGNGFYYYNGTSWERLSDGSGILAVTAGGTGTSTQFTPGSVVFAGPSGVYSQDNANFFWDDASHRLGLGIPAPATNLHVYEQNGDLVPASLIEQDNSFNGTFGDAAMQYKLTLVDGTVTNITTGIDEDDNSNFKISNASTLTGNTYTDANTMLRIHTEGDASGSSVGIADINHQSRARAYLGAQQTIPNAVWTGVGFDLISYDEHGEFMPGFPGAVPPPPLSVPGQFVALEDGYYQVNARAEFAPLDDDIVGQGYVSIAIFKNSLPYAVGNNLQMTLVSGELMEKNNAPNVSDVLELFAGDKIEIYVFQTFSAPNAILIVTDMTLPPFQTPSPAVTYVSIHKIS